MAREIDERVVEMRFDNKEFEKNAGDSITTLQKLKEALNFSKSGDSLEALDKAEKKNATNMDQLVAGVTALQKRFSVFGIMSMRAVENVTDSLMGLANRGISYVTSSIKQGGMNRAFNIENANFSLQALLKDEKKVQKIMDQAMDSVNDTAYGFDEAAKAAAGFAASGVKAGKNMKQALAGITGVAAMTNSQYSDIAMIFNTVSGNGRLMGDQLLQFSARGLNAASTIKDYYREVKKNTKITEQDIRDMVSKGEISFKTFAKAMNWAFGDSAKKANETFNGALSNMKAALGRIGAEFYAPLIAQNSEVVKLINVMKERINDVKKGLTLSDEKTGFTAFSKEVTDTILALAKATSEYLTNFDVSPYIDIFYDFTKVVKNSAKGLYRVLKPLGKAFYEVFLKGINLKGISSFTKSLVTLTSKFKLAKKETKNLRDAFKGAFDIIKLATNLLFRFAQAFLPVNKPVKSLGEYLLELAGAGGRALSEFSEMVSKSKKVNSFFTGLNKKVKSASEGTLKFGSALKDVVARIRECETLNKIVNGLGTGIAFLGQKGAKALSFVVERMGNFKDIVMEFVPKIFEALANTIIERVTGLRNALGKLKLDKPTVMLNKFVRALKGLLDLAKGNAGIMAFVTNMNEFGRTIRENLTFDKLYGRIRKFKELIGDLVGWFKEHVTPIFSDVTLGGVVSAGSAAGLIYAIVKMSKAIQSVAGSIKNVPNIFSELSKALKTYQKEVDANYIIKIAGAIAILAGALVMLSFADPNRLFVAAMSLAAVAGVFLFGIAKWKEATNKAKPITKTIDRTGEEMAKAFQTLARGVSVGINNLTKAVKRKALGKLLKDFAASLSIIAGVIILLGETYKKDDAVIKDGLMIFEGIVWTIVGALAAMTILDQSLGKKKSVVAPAASCLAMAISLTLAISALRKLFKMEFPKDWLKKVGTLIAIFVALGAVSTIMSKGAISKKDTKISNSPLIALSLSLYMAVSALKKLMDMEFGEDWAWKVSILGLIIAELGMIAIIIARFSSGTGGAIKAATTLLALAILIPIIVGALAILMVFPADKLQKSVEALGVILVALGIALAGAGTVADVGAAKAVLAMALTVGAITLSLAILALIPIDKLAKAAVALGSMLLIIALNLSQVKKISTQDAGKAVLAMVAVIAAVTISLAVLAGQPWDGLLAASLSLSLVILSLTATFAVISNAKDINPGKIGSFILACLSLIPITLAIGVLSTQPWDSVLSAGLSITAVLLSLTLAFKIIDTCNPNMTSIGSFLLASLAVVAIGYALKELAGQDWKSILYAGTSVSMVLLSMTAALAVCTLIGSAAPAAIAGIVALDIFIADLVAVLAALGGLSKIEGFNDLISSGSSVLEQLGEALGGFVSGFAVGATSGLKEIGQNLSEFMLATTPFFIGAKAIDPTAMEGIKSLVQSLLLLTAADFLDGIANLFGMGSVSLVDFGKQIVEFAPYISSFATAVSGIDAGSVEGAAAATEVMVKLANSMPKEGGLVGWLMGNTMDLSEFGKKLVQLGTGISDFVAETKGITPDTVQSASDAASILVELGKKTPKTGGLLQKLIGGSDMSSFGTNIKAFGEGLSAFSSYASTVNTSRIYEVCDAINEFVETAKNANGVSTEGVKNMASSMKTMGSGAMSSVAKTTAKAGGEVSKAMNSAINGALDSISSSNSKFQNEGAKNTESYSKGVDSKKSKAKSSGKGIVQSVIDGAKSLAGKMKDIGKNEGQGYVEGIRSKISAAKDAGEALSAASQSGTKKKSQQKSPSKAFRRIGVFDGVGYMIGLASMAKDAYKEGENLSLQTQKGTKLGLQGISKVFDSLDTDPVITPRVDLTGVQQSADNMNRMFNRAIHTTVDAAGSISVMQRRNETSEILSALKGLELQAAGVGGDSYYINGLNYSEDQNVGNAIKSLVGAVVVQGRV